jgi:hypothetical protein
VRRAFALAAHGEAGRVVPVLEIARRFNDARVPTYNAERSGGRAQRPTAATVGGAVAPAPPAPERASPAQWAKNSMNQLLVNETYVGVLRAADDTPHQALWEPLIDKATWQRVQARFAANAAQPRGVNTDFTLSGLLHCARCGAPLCGERQRRRAATGGHIDYYRRTKAASRAAPCPACRCRIPAEALEPPVLDAVAALADAPHIQRAIAAERAALAAGRESLAARLDALDAEAQEVRRQIDNLLPLLEKGGAAAERVHARLDALNADAARIDIVREAAAGTGGQPAQAFAAAAARFRDVWAAAGPAERREALRCFVAGIEVDGERGVVRVSVRRPDGVAA